MLSLNTMECGGETRELGNNMILRHFCILGCVTMCETEQCLVLLFRLHVGVDANTPPPTLTPTPVVRPHIPLRSRRLAVSHH